MPTSSLTPDGLKRYNRWLAVQKAKGRVPSATEVSSFLQGEIEANIASDTEREKLSLGREQLDISRGHLGVAESQLDINRARSADVRAYDTRRLDLLEDEQDYARRADKIRGISDIAKLTLSINEGTGGALWEGAKAVGGAAYDFGSSLFDAWETVAPAFDYADYTSDVIAQFDMSDVIPDWEIFGSLF